MKIPRIAILLLGLSCLLQIGSGCAGRHQKAWSTPHYLKPSLVSASHFTAPASDQEESRSEQTYREAITFENQENAECVDLYALAAQQAWNAISLENDSDFPQQAKRQLEVYRSALAKLISTSQQFGKFDSINGIKLKDGNTIPITYTEMEWTPLELAKLEVVGEYKVPKNTRIHQQTGIGVPLLAHPETSRKYTPTGTVCVATAVLRQASNHPTEYKLEIINSLKVQELSVDGKILPLAVDFTAPLGYLNARASRLGVRGLLKPHQAEEHGGLQMIAPYQRGKIPVVFIHGLASDPLTWGSMANDVFINKELMDSFQFWTFSYPTGNPFPEEAAKLRRQLVQLRMHIDPDHTDTALDNMVLIGHSMGGLVAKMQITTSEDELIQSMSSVPLDQLQLKPEARAKFAEYFQFTPSAQVKRVIFIGTPHKGSGLAKGIASRLASRMIRQPDDLIKGFNELVENNQRVFTSDFRKNPNSIDLLNPDNELTKAIFLLPVNPDVALHSIIGVGHGGIWGRERSDGVVTYASAQHPGVDSELTVEAGHRLHNHPDSTAEVVRILRLHAAQAYSTTTANHDTNSVPTLFNSSR